MKGIRNLGFREENTTILEDPSWSEVHLKIMELAMNL